MSDDERVEVNPDPLKFAPIPVIRYYDGNLLHNAADMPRSGYTPWEATQARFGSLDKLIAEEFRALRRAVKEAFVTPRVVAPEGSE
jgi:hypothetical protein